MLVSSISSIIRSISSNLDDTVMVLGIVVETSIKATRRCGDGRRSWCGKSDHNGDVCEDVGADGAMSREVEGWCEELPGLAMKRRVSTASASIAAL